MASDNSFYAPAAEGLERSDVRTYVRPSVAQVKIFVQGRISRSINGRKLIFHMRVYFYEASRNIQEPWPIINSTLTS